MTTKYSEDLEPYAMVLTQDGVFGEVLAKRLAYSFVGPTGYQHSVYAYAVDLELGPDLPVTEILFETDCQVIGVPRAILKYIQIEYGDALVRKDTTYADELIKLQDKFAAFLARVMHTKIDLTEVVRNV